MILDQNRSVLVASVICLQKTFGLQGLKNHQIIEYWVSRGQYWLIFGGTGSEQGGTGCQHDEVSENIWFGWSKSSNYWIFEEGKSDYGQTNRQTDRISFCRLDPFCRRGREKLRIKEIHEKDSELLQLTIYVLTLPPSLLPRRVHCDISLFLNQHQHLCSCTTLHWKQ